ncbi:PAS domain S-box protein [Leptospira ognonensis]|uniref:histidine kinase n=1 Tax=Leptospira ognonensis TaxID=2484945 RepID=A0A4R9K2A7_9LEPT|nr:PAS domain S-box protein [Leptospira ognonensis]TGL60133.1 PAS domain S-box protein [Leptospira ognonensis]
MTKIPDFENDSSLILQYLYDAVIVTDRDFRITNWNQSAEKIYGYLASEVIGKTAPEVLKTEFTTLDRESSIKSLNETGIWLGEVTQVNRRGDRINIRSAVSLLKDAHQNVIGAIAVNRDITKEKEIQNKLIESEARFRSSFENAGSGVCLQDTNGKFLQVNRKLCSMLNYSEEELIGRNTSEFAISSDAEISKSFREQALLGEANEIVYEKRYHRKDESILYAEIYSSLVKTQTGEPAYFVTHFIDISKRKNVEELLHRSKDEAERANRAKSDFIANMSHEIRTPLNGVIGYNQLMFSTNLTETQSDYITKAISSAQGLLGIINDILDISKIEAGKIELHEEYVLLSQMIEESIELFSWNVKQKGIFLNLEISPTLPKYILVDPVRLRQILINLVGNAVKFTERGGVILKISSFESKKQNHVGLQFEIIDTGIGISTESLGRLFESFWQAESNSTRRFGGTGLGLRITKSLVDMMQGNIFVASELDQGSTFCFELEVEYRDILFENGGKENEGIIQEQHLAPDRFKNSSPKIMIVEDNDLNRDLLGKMIHRFIPMAELFDAADGMIALQKLSEMKPDLIFMDIQMPNMDGLSATKEIRKQKELESVSIVALTAGALYEERARCFEVGMNYFLPKPIDIIALKQVLVRYLITKSDP